MHSTLSILLFAPLTLASRACYKFTQRATWTEGGDLDEHFSPIIGWATSYPENPIWSKDELASAGIQDMAETGNTDALVSELEEALADDTIGLYWLGERLASPGEQEMYFFVEEEHPYTHWVTMAAPSPDWFIAESITLYKDGAWVDRVEKEDIDTYDAGTDSGETFDAADSPTDPQGNITEHEGQEFSEGTADWVFERQSGEGRCVDTTVQTVTDDQIQRGAGSEVASGMVVVMALVVAVLA